MLKENLIIRDLRFHSPFVFEQWTKIFGRKWIDEKVKSGKKSHNNNNNNPATIWRWKHNLITFQRKTSKFLESIRFWNECGFFYVRIKSISEYFNKSEAQKLFFFCSSSAKQWKRFSPLVSRFVFSSSSHWIMFLYCETRNSEWEEKYEIEFTKAKKISLASEWEEKVKSKIEHWRQKVNRTCEKNQSRVD